MTVEVPELSSPRHEPQMFSAPRRKPDGRQNPAAEVGYFLSREREGFGLTIEAVAEATGIHPYHLEAIETGDLTRMPPRMEAMELIAGYANYLGFEVEPLIEHLLSFLPPPPVVRRAYHPANPPILSSAKVLPFGQGPKIPSLNIRLANYPGGKGGVLASVLAAFLVIGGGAHFAISNHGDVGDVSIAPPAQEQVAVAVAPAPAPVKKVKPQADNMATASNGAVKVTDTPLPQGQQIASADAGSDPSDDLGAFIQDQTADPVVKPTKPGKVASDSARKIQDRINIEDQLKVASITPIPTPSDGRIYGSENKDAHVILKATAPVWLRIEDAQGIAVMTQMLNTGDTYMVPNRDGLVAMSRDGGRLAFLIDGQEKGVLGPPGKILVNEKLDVAALQAKK